MQRIALLTLAGALTPRVGAFAPAGPPSARRHNAFAPTARPLRAAGARRPPRVAPLHAENPIRKYGGSVLLGGFGLLSLRDLVLEVPRLGEGRFDDIWATVIDVGFLAFAANSLLQQSGATVAEPSASLAGLEARVTLSVGREAGTWMDKQWAASGARLLLPVTATFTDEVLDLGFPGEEALGGRYCRRIDCSGGTFVGPRGTETVAVDGGGWATTPMGAEGESAVRFFLDFPNEATRNDVSLPAGRVFFSSACFEGEAGADVPATELFEGGPPGLRLLNSGGLTIKKNTLLNLWGALGDVNLILGRYSLGSAREERGGGE